MVTVHRRITLLVALTAFVGAFTGTARGLENDLGVEVRTARIGEPVDSIDVVVPGAATEVTQQLFLTQPGGDPITDVQLVAGIDGAAVTFTPFGGAAGDAFTIPAGGEAVLVIATVTKADQGTVSGELLAIPGLVKIADLSVSKTSSAAIDVLGADAASGLTLSTNDPEFRHTAQIVSSSPSSVDVRIEVPPFADPDGVQHTPGVEVNTASVTGSTTIAVGARTSVPLAISLSTPKAGDYTGSIRLVFDDQTRVIPVKVTRNDVASTVVFDAAVSQRATSSNAPFEVTIREGEGVPATVDRIVVLPIVEVLSDDSEIGTNATAKLSSDGSSITEPIRFVAGQTRSIDIDVTDLPGPGKYKVTLRLTSGDDTPLEQSTTIFVRRSALFAFLVLFLAISASAAFRWYFTVHRGRLLAQEQIAQLLDRLAEIRVRAGDLDAAEVRLFERVYAHLTELNRSATGRAPKDVSAGLEFIRLKLDGLLWRWLDARRRARRAGAADLLDALAKVEKTLTMPGPSTGTAEEVTNAARTIVGDVENKLDSDFGMAKRVENFRAAIKDLQSQGGPVPAIARVSTLLNQIVQGSADDEDRYAEALRAWAQVCISLFEESIPSEDEPPLGFDNATWSAKRRDLAEYVEAARAAKDPRRTLEQCNHGSALLARTLLEGLRVRAQERASVFQNASGASNEAIAVGLTKLASEIELALPALADKDPSTYLTAYKEALTSYQKLIPAARQQSGEKPVAATVLAPTVTLPASGSGVRAVPVEASLPSSRSIKQKLFWYEILTSVVILAVAAVVGAEALYFDNPTWGSAGDLVVAVLWGLSLKEVGGKAFEGTAKLRQNFGGS